MTAAAPELEPLGLPEPCGRPRLVLTCVRCGLSAGWVIPTPGHRAMVMELAERAGWKGITLDPCWCPACVLAFARYAPNPKQERRPGHGGRTYYCPSLLTKCRDMRADGVTWKDVAAYVSTQVGWHVQPDTLCQLIGSHRRKVLAKAAELARQWDGPGRP